MAIKIKSFNEILGDMIRKIVSETPLNDINAGSVLLTLLEAAAANDFENNTSILNVLELLNIDAIKNNDLDAKAGDFGLSRKAAVKASGLVDLYNNNIVKRSTGLYVIKPAPIAGQTRLYVNTAVGWSNSGTLYIGRGTQNFEGPIAYSSVVVYPTYSEIVLVSALQKDHLISDSVIDSQGEPDRLIGAGTIVKIPANNQNPEIQYSTLRDVVIPSGENKVSNADVVALVAGSSGNAGVNTITDFESIPFTGASVANTSSFSNGRDIETDTELRNRLKSYSITLARGTAPSIISSVIGISDPVDSNQVASAVMTEPVKVGSPSVLYIDDGSGFQPSYAGQSVDKLLSNATGREEFLQLSNYPIPRPQVVNTNSGPFTLLDGSFLKVIVDGQEETIYFNSKQFLNISAATIAEIVTSINDKSVFFKARFTDNSTAILLYPVDHDAEIIQVAEKQTHDNLLYYANSVLKFPTDEFSYLSLYQNNNKLREKAKNAELTTTTYSQWNINSTSNIIISVDNTPVQDRNFTLSDFAGVSSFSSLTIDNWVEAFNKKFAGLTAKATPSSTMIIKSNKNGSESSIFISGGTLLNKWFSNLPTSSVGKTAEFQLNRQTGNLRILTNIGIGDNFSAGIEDAKGFAISSITSSGKYNLSADSAGKAANMVLVVDSTYCNKKLLPLLVGSTIDITTPIANSIMRITSSVVNTFASLKPGDFIFISKKSSGWITNTQNTGLFKIMAKGNHTSSVNSFVEVENPAAIVESAIIVSDSSDIKAFETDGYPQIWRGSYLSNPPAETISEVIKSLNRDVVGVLATLYKSNSIKITSTAEKNGNVAIPVSNSNCSAVFAETLSTRFGNQPHIATKIAEKALFGNIKTTVPVSTNVFLDRHTYTDIRSKLALNTSPAVPPYSDPYSEIIYAVDTFTPTSVELDDIVSFTKGNNKGQIRSVKTKFTNEGFGTQQGVARTELIHTTNDEFQLIRPVNISSEDSVVAIIDKNATANTIDIKMSRTGIINSGSDSLLFTPTTTEFSASDYDNEPGVDFSNLTVWGSSINGTDFSDYAIWMRARNWYSTGGVLGSNGKILVRASQYGPNGEKLRFAFEYPTSANQTQKTTYLNTPSYSIYKYFFGSGPARTTTISSGDNLTISGPYPDTNTNFPNGAASTGNYYDYKFSAGNLSTVLIGDILSISVNSGISNTNMGQFYVENKNGLTVRVLNPNAAITPAGTPEITTVTTTDDIVGTPTIYDVEASADIGGSLHQTYFIIHDTQGSVAVWYDVDNTGVSAPAHGASRAIKIATVATNDSNTVVATKTSQTLSLDSAFTVGLTGSKVTITNVINGLLPSGLSGTSGFSINTTNGTPNITADGKFFTIHDENGSVAVWYDVDNNGTLEPFHGATRSIKVSGVVSGDTAAVVAAATVAAINPDLLFNASNINSVITITNANNGNMVDASANTSGFTISSTNGSSSTSELITNSGDIAFFSLQGTDVQSMVSKINQEQILEITAVSSTSSIINRSTVQEKYTYTDNSTALAYGHNPNSLDNNHIKLYDSVNWVKSFQNSNPNFIAKRDFILNNVAPSVYQMNTAPNYNISSIGELFKLIPVSVKNIHHHLTQKALSQLPIISNVRIANDRKNIQITSKNLGSTGAIEIVGGNANKAQAYIYNESEIKSDLSGNYLLVKIPAFPDTFNRGDYVKLQNDSGVKRLSRLITTDTIDITSTTIGTTEYNFNPKITNITSSTSFTITDVSALYARPTGFIWRWTHSGSATFAQVKAGDLITAFGPTLSWDQGNKARFSGDSNVAGLPIVAVNDISNYVDVVNPYGKAMPSTAIGVGNTVHITPTPIIKWNLAHSSRVSITSIQRSSGVITVAANSAHFMNSGDMVNIIDSNLLIDGNYGPIIAISPSQFTFTNAGSDLLENVVGASLIKDGLTPTRYRVEKLGHNSLIRVSRRDGQSPRFIDSGVAVDDYMIISGLTFKANNNGTFRVIAVDNDSVIIENNLASEELNTIKLFNNKNLQATWTANTNIITGTAGTFKDVVVGDWVKKPEDPDSYYSQVVSLIPSDPVLATQATMGSNYGGSTAISAGVSYDMLNDYDKGIELLNVDDLVFLEGDSAIGGDTLSIQNIVNPNWFSINNVGNFKLANVGTNSNTYKPFLRVNNSAGSAESNKLLSINTNGFYLTEGLANKFYSIRKIENIQLDDLNKERRALYLTPHNRNYKFSNSNATSVLHMGKLNYNTDVTIGIDGYLYYTGLLQRVQRVIDGYEPDADNFPGRRAVGGAIETLPPLIKKISIALNITTADGVNLGDISNNIKSSVINYVQTLGVGEDVILSEIIAITMSIKGVGAVTFTSPSPSTERITIANNEKATIDIDSIGIA